MCQALPYARPRILIKGLWSRTVACSVKSQQNDTERALWLVKPPNSSSMSSARLCCHILWPALQWNAQVSYGWCVWISQHDHTGLSAMDMGCLWLWSRWLIGKKPRWWGSFLRSPDTLSFNVRHPHRMSRLRHNSCQTPYPSSSREQVLQTTHS